MICRQKVKAMYFTIYYVSRRSRTRDTVKLTVCVSVFLYDWKRTLNLCSAVMFHMHPRYAPPTSIMHKHSIHVALSYIRFAGRNSTVVCVLLKSN